MHCNAIARSNRNLATNQTRHGRTEPNQAPSLARAAAAAAAAGRRPPTKTLHPTRAALPDGGRRRASTSDSYNLACCVKRNTPGKPMHKGVECTGLIASVVMLASSLARTTDPMRTGSCWLGSRYRSRSRPPRAAPASVGKQASQENAAVLCCAVATRCHGVAWDGVGRGH